MVIQAGLVRKSMHALAMSALVVACSRNDGGASDPPVEIESTPAVTEIATPIGTPARATLGAAGGSLISADGKLTLELPPNALSVDTELTITPIANVAPGSVASYRLEPEGIQFASAVTLRFATSEADLRGTTPEALRIATQTAERTWRVFADAAIAADSIAITTTHFSDYSLLYGWQIRPGEATVRPGQRQALTIRYCALTEAELEGELVPIAAECQSDQGLAPLLRNPSVNGVRGGSAAVGTVALDESTLSYLAPAKAPDTNPVAVSVEVGDGKARVTLVSNIRVTDQALPYVGTVTFFTQQENFTVEGRADVTWDLKHEGPDTHTYTPTGNVHVTYTQSSPQCQPVEGTYPIEKGELSIYPEGAVMFARSYTFNLHAEPEVSMTCAGSDGKTVTFAAKIPIFMQAGGCDGTATLASYTDENVLAGEGACAPAGITSSSWELRRAE